jgi:hypothetical protein
MVNLHLESFVVKVFLSASLLDVEPDFVETVSAVTMESAVYDVLARCAVSEAGVVYVLGPGRQECWLYGVSFVGGTLVWEHIV